MFGSGFCIYDPFFRCVSKGYIAIFCLVYIDDLIERLKLIVDFAKRNKIELSLCGEIGAYEKYLVRLIDIGINIFSVNLPSIANVVNVISKKALNKDN